MFGSVSIQAGSWRNSQDQSGSTGSTELPIQLGRFLPSPALPIPGAPFGRCSGRRAQHLPGFCAPRGRRSAPGEDGVCAPMALCPTHSRAGAQHPKGQTST